MKQTKMVKFIFASALLLLVTLLFVGIIQSVTLQIKRNELAQSQSVLQQKQQEKEQKQDILDYLNSDEYKEEYYKHEGNDGDHYGNEGDIEVVIK